MLTQRETTVKIAFIVKQKRRALTIPLSQRSHVSDFNCSNHYYTLLHIGN